jgi:flagellar FliL protein
MADAKTEAAPEAVAPNKKMGLMMAIIVLLALTVGGGAAYLFMSGKKEAAAKEAAEAKDKPVHKEPAQYVKLDPPFVVNFEAKGMMRFLQVTVEVMTRDPATVELVKQNDPMIRNDLILLFGNQTYQTISTREGKDQLRAEALKVVSDVITAEGGDGAKVEQLFFTSFVMQ